MSDLAKVNPENIVNPAAIVAVYGTLMSGCPNNHILTEGDSDFLGKGYTGDQWNMYSLGGFPFIVPNGDIHVAVELYRVRVDTFRRLDQLEGYPNFYDRRMVKIHDAHYKAWIYFHHTNRYDQADPIYSGDWKNYRYGTKQEVPF